MQKYESFFMDNPYISIDTLYGNYTFEVFAAYETPISFNYINTEFEDRQEWFEFIQTLQEKSLFKRDIELTEDDVVLTLSTCTNKHIHSQRFVVNARLVNPELYDTEYTYIY
jgi:sortase B